MEEYAMDLLAAAVQLVTEADFVSYVSRLRTNATQQTRNQICIKIYIKITNISVCQTDLLQGNINN